MDTKDYFEYTPGILRALVEPAHLGQLQCALPTKHVRSVVGEAMDFREGELTVQRGPELETITFDYLLLASGSTYAGPIKPSSAEPTRALRRNTIAAEARALAAVRSVLIVGAGAVGVELAAEILERFRDKRVTLVDKAPTVLAQFGKATVEYCTDWLLAHGCDLRLGIDLASIDEHGCTAASGARIDAERVYTCVGAKPASARLRPFFDGSMDARGALIVDEHLRVVGHPHVFAMGDVMVHAQSNDAKLGHTAELNARLVCENLSALDAAKAYGRRTRLLRYPHDISGGATPLIYIISLGKYDASLGFNWLVVNGPPPSTPPTYTRTRARRARARTGRAAMRSAGRCGQRVREVVHRGDEDDGCERAGGRHRAVGRRGLVLAASRINGP